MRRTFYTFNYLYAEPGSKTFLTGIREVKNSKKEFYISGVYTPPNSNQTNGLIYKGYINSTLMDRVADNGQWSMLNYPSKEEETVTSTSLYGPNNGKKKGDIQVVGSYKTKETGNKDLGCLYIGKFDGTGKWYKLLPSFDEEIVGVIAHSTMGDLVVGNYDTKSIVGKAFIYDIKEKKYYDISTLQTNINAKSITAYGIYYNGCDKYTICGGYSNLKNEELTYSYIVDWNNKTNKFSNFRTYSYNNDISFITHFHGISAYGKNGYTLTGDYVDFNKQKHGFIVYIKNKKDRKINGLSIGKWELIEYQNQKITSANSIYYETVIGIYISQNNQVNGFISNIND